MKGTMPTSETTTQTQNVPYTPMHDIAPAGPFSSFGYWFSNLLGISPIDMMLHDEQRDTWYDEQWEIDQHLRIDKWKADNPDRDPKTNPFIPETGAKLGDVRTIGGYEYTWDGSNWVLVDSPDPDASSSLFGDNMLMPILMISLLGGGFGASEGGIGGGIMGFLLPMLLFGGGDLFGGLFGNNSTDDSSGPPLIIPGDDDTTPPNTRGVSGGGR